MSFSVGTERRARKTRNSVIVQQPIGALRTRHPGLPDVREHIERALGHTTGDARDRIQARHDAIATLLEERCKILRRLGLKAHWAANIPQVMPEAFFTA